MFDDDNTLAYEPSQTAAIILTGGDEEAEKAAREVWQASCLRTAMFRSPTPSIVWYAD